MLIGEINNKEIRRELYNIFNKLCELENNPFYNPYYDIKKTVDGIIKLEEENQDLSVLNETLKDMNEQSQNKIKELEKEKEKLISDLVKMQNELNFVKCQNDLLRIEIYNCQGELL